MNTPKDLEMWDTDFAKANGLYAGLKPEPAIMPAKASKVNEAQAAAFILDNGLDALETPPTSPLQTNAYIPSEQEVARLRQFLYH